MWGPTGSPENQATAQAGSSHGLKSKRFSHSLHSALAKLVRHTDVTMTTWSSEHPSLYMQNESGLEHSQGRTPSDTTGTALTLRKAEWVHCGGWCKHRGHNAAVTWCWGFIRCACIHLYTNQGGSANNWRLTPNNWSLGKKKKPYYSSENNATDFNLI